MPADDLTGSLAYTYTQEMDAYMRTGLTQVTEALNQTLPIDTLLAQTLECFGIAVDSEDPPMDPVQCQPHCAVA